MKIPVNIAGKAVDIEHSVTEPTEEEAIKTFNRACKRLQNPQVWKEIAGTFSASFHISNSEQSNPQRLTRVSDHLRINIPSLGKGYDWVRVAAISERADPVDGDEFGIQLRPSVNPDKPHEGIAHFFKKDASSTFIIQRKGKVVKAYYHGRNEVPNTNDVPLVDKVRNKIVAEGALAGVSAVQWKALIKGLLTKEL